MPSYAYKGVAASGRNVSGTVEAESPRAARARLRERSVFASELHEASASGRAGLAVRRPGQSVGAAELGRTLRQLATLLAAGWPVVEALDSLLTRGMRPRMQASLTTLRAQIVEGAGLAQAMSTMPAVFPPIYAGMVEAGETSGALDKVLVRIADHAESAARLRAKVQGALAYPAIMAIIGSGIVAFLLAYVVPQVSRVFAEAGHGLPLPTRVLMSLGQAISAFGPAALLVGLAATLGARLAWANPTAKRRMEKVVLATPWVGRLSRDVQTARVTHTLATLLGGGVTVVAALAACRSAAGQGLFADAVELARTEISEGRPLASSLEASAVLSPMAVDMIRVGEKSSDLENMLNSAAHSLDEEIRLRLDMAASVLEPAIVVAMAGVVLFVVLAILLPIFEMNQLVR